MRDAFVTGLDIMGAHTAIGPRQTNAHDEVLGAYDIATIQQQLNSIKPVHVRVAQPLERGGMDIINWARSMANMMSLPGGTARDNVYWKLKWHEDALSKVASTPDAVYDPGDDLKKWVMQAFIEANAVQEGAQYINDAWIRMWSDIGDAIAALPAQTAKAIKASVQAAVEGAQTVAWYAKAGVWLIAALVVGVIGTLAWGVSKSISTGNASRFLPGRV